MSLDYDFRIKKSIECLNNKDFENLAIHIDYLYSNYKNKTEVYNLAGLFYIHINNYDKAMKYFRDGLEIKPDAKIFHNMAYIYSNNGDHEKCIDYSLKALSTDYTHLVSYDMILMNILYLEKLPENLINYRYINPYTRVHNFFLEKNKNLENYQKFLADMLYNYKYKEKPLIVNWNTNKQNIGYITADLKGHACSLFINTLLTHYDKNKYKIYVYLTDKVQLYENEYKDIIFVDITECNIDDCIDLFRTHNIHHLVELTGFTKGNRMTLYSVLGNMKTNIKLYTYLGFPAHTYINKFIRISDSYTEAFNKTLYKNYKLLDRFFLCFNYENKQFEKNIYKYRLSSPYKNYKYVLGSFAKLQKINDNVIRVWKLIMDKLDDYIFILKSKTFESEKTKIEWKNKFVGYNVLLVETLDYEDHLKHYTYLDIQLDTFPYSGTTISCESLYMNTKVITLPAKTHVSRVSASLLNEMSKYDSVFSKFICKDENEYVENCLKYIKKEFACRANFLKVMNKKNFMSEYEKVFNN